MEPVGAVLFPHDATVTKDGGSQVVVSDRPLRLNPSA